MRDIIRDAAILTVAKHVMEDRNWMGVDTFLQTYAEKETDREELRNTLGLFGLIRGEYFEPRWGNEGRYVWYWTND